MALPGSTKSYSLNAIVWRSSTMDDLIEVEHAAFGELTSVTPSPGVWTHIECRWNYLKTAFVALLRSVYHTVLTLISTLSLFCEAGRHFWKETAVHALIDFSGIGIGLVGLFSPYIAAVLIEKERAWLFQPPAKPVEYVLEMFPKEVAEVVAPLGAGEHADEEDTGEGVSPTPGSKSRRGEHDVDPADLEGLDLSGLDHKHSSRG